jgi:hypothetical protein
MTTHRWRGFTFIRYRFFKQREFSYIWAPDIKLVRINIHHFELHWSNRGYRALAGQLFGTEA